MTTSTPYLQAHTNFHVACLDPDQHSRTCGYWYTVTSHSQAHTAFSTKVALLDWLNERGLTLSDALPDEQGTFKSIPVAGTYLEASYMDASAFMAITPALKIAQLSNARYTLGKVTEDADGIRTVHYLNVNVKERITFPYALINDRQSGWRDAIFDSPDIAHLHTVYWTRTGVGCYGTDAEGNPWTTFEAINHGYECAECGMWLQRGWAMGKLGDEQHFCSGHINFIEQGSDEASHV